MPQIPRVVLILAAILLAWMLLRLLARRLETAFHSVWVGLSRPTGLPQVFSSAEEAWRVWRSNLSLFRFVWSRQHADLHDGQLTTLIWSSRASYVLLAILIVLSFWRT
jgi:hypothetical protein